jgi:predicted HD phosphohydrolase
MKLDQTRERILSLFRNYGHQDYGEHITQLSHGVQAGLIAKNKGLDEELVLAAFLHDIGHLYPLEFEQAAYQTMGDFGMEEHDHWGAACLLEAGYSERMAAVVRNHVVAKRYLCYAEPGYYEQLSDASRETLRYQGGPMDEAEAKAFEAAPFFSESIILRRIDEEAKEQNFEVTSEHWDYFSGLMVSVAVGSSGSGQ